MAWYLNPALTGFRAAVNDAYPNRDRTSDGTIGDTAHQGTASDHNPDPDGSVDAWDMDVDLRSGNDAAEIEHLKAVFQAHPSSRYWIHNREEASRSTGWRRVRYTGSNPHTGHVHWNTREQFENSQAPWPVEQGDDEDMPSAEETATAVWFRDIESGPAVEPAWKVLDKAGEDAAAALAAARWPTRRRTGSWPSSPSCGP